MNKNTLRHSKQPKNRRFINDGKIALGITIGLVIAFFGAVLAWHFRIGLTANEFLDVGPTLIALIVAATSAVLAGIALREQRMMREAGTDPVLVAHFGQREDARELVTFNVSNIGAGAAMNVALEVEKPEDDLTGRDIFQDVFVRHHPFRVIRQGTSISFPLAMGWNLLGENPLPPFSVKLSYEDIEGTEYWTQSTLDVREMEKLGAEKSPIMRAVIALEKIAKKSA